MEKELKDKLLKRKEKLLEELKLIDDILNETTKEEMKNLKRGELFSIDGVILKASQDAYFDKNINQYIVFDESNKGWFEESFK